MKRPTRPSAALANAGVRPAKSHGQNFLVQAAIAQKIAMAACLDSNDDVIEVGAGLGILSDHILAHPVRRLTLIELDSRLASALSERFAKQTMVRVVNGDFLDLDLSALVGRQPFKVIGNLPFNAAAAILHRLCDWHHLIARMVLMFQREVAERIRARPGQPSYSALSVYTALYWEIESHFRVSAGSFHPRPKVDAEVLTMMPRDPMPCAASELPRVLAAIARAFSSRRKTLRNALSGGDLTPSDAASALERSGIDPQVRAETLSVTDFIRLARELPISTRRAGTR